MRLPASPVCHIGGPFVSCLQAQALHVVLRARAAEESVRAAVPELVSSLLDALAQLREDMSKTASGSRDEEPLRRVRGLLLRALLSVAEQHFEVVVTQVAFRARPALPVRRS